MTDTVYAVFRRINGGEWEFYTTSTRRQSSLYSKKSTAQSIATRESATEYRYNSRNDKEYEYKVMKLSGEWEDID